MLEQIKPSVSSTTLEIHKIKETSTVNSGRLTTIQLDVTFPTRNQTGIIKRRYIREFSVIVKKTKIEQKNLIM